MTNPSRRLTATDASFLYLERDNAPMHIGAVCLINGEVPFEDYLSSIESKLGLLPRFRERVVPTPFYVGHPTWEPDPDFDIHRHVLPHRLPTPGDDAALQDLAAKIIAPRLDRRKPLWELHVIEGLAGGRSAIVSKVHHAMVDGVGGNQILTTVLDLHPEPHKPSQELEPLAAVPDRDPAARIMDAVWDNARTSVDLWNDSMRRFIDTGRGLDQEQIQRTLYVLSQSMPELAMPPRRLPFNHSYTSERKLAWCRISFADARAIRRALSGTVNDVVLTTLAGAVAAYCRHHGEKTERRSMRVMVPVNLRPESDSAALGNQVSVLPVSLPLDVDDPAHRLRFVREKTRSLKSANVADGIAMLTNLVGASPPPLQAALGAMAVAPLPIFNLVCTNVPGPQIPLYAMGHELAAYYPYVPVGHEMGLACAIFSYNQYLHVGFTADARACPDVDLVGRLFDTSFAELMSAAGVDPIDRVETRAPRKKAAPKKKRTTRPTKSPARRPTRSPRVSP